MSNLRAFSENNIRPLKFRAWVGKMEYSIAVSPYGVFYVNPGAKGDGLDVNDSATLTPFNTKLGDVPVMQFTGLYDKHKKEIWEGDIVQFSDKWEWYRGMYSLSKTKEEIEQLPYGRSVVKWNDRDGCWEMIGGISDLHQYIEVVGTIYENPELLRKHENQA